MPALEYDEDKVKEGKVQNLNSKQTINQSSSIISPNESWKQFIQTKKRNQTNIISTSST